MAAISVNRFFGAVPGIAKRLIGQGYAQRSVNADTAQGTLKPVRGSSVDGSISRTNAESMFLYPNGKWLSWAADVDVVRSPLADDPHGRIYWTGEGPPRMAAINSATAGSAPYPGASHLLGVPQPPTVPLASGPTEEEPATALDAVYAVAYVSEYDEVGPLSLPSASVTRWDGADVNLTLPAIDAPGRNIAKLRIFRSETGGTFNFVADVPAGTGTYIDSVKTDDANVPANSIDFDLPPEGLKGLIAGPGGALYGFFDNVLCASEPGHPHAWPVGHRITFQDEIVGIAESAAGIAVATAGMPGLAVGSTPSAMTRAKIEQVEPCLSKRSIVDMGEYVVYASPNGLVGIGSSGAVLMTKKLISRDAWRALTPENYHAYRYRDMYLAFDRTGNRGFAFSPERGFEFFELPHTYFAGHYVGSADQLYLTTSNGDLHVWEEGGPMPLSWRSGILETQPGTNFTCGKIVADLYPVTLKMFADGDEALSISIPSEQMFRLPSGKGHVREWEVELQSANEVFSFQIAQSPQELV